MTILNYGTDLHHFDDFAVGELDIDALTTTTAEMQSVLYLRGGYVGDGARLFFAAQTDFWLHFRFQAASGSVTNGIVFLILKGGGNSLFRFQITSTGFVFKVEYWNDTVWADLMTGLTLFSGISEVWDIHIVMHDSTGKFDFYVDQKLKASFSGDTLLSSQADCDAVYFDRVGTGTRNAYWGNCLIANEDTRKMEIVDLRSVADGNYSQFTSGSEADIDDVAIEPLSSVDATFAQSQFNDQKMTVTLDDITSRFDIGYDVVCVGVKARLKKVASGPNARLMVRENVTDGEGSTETITSDFEPYTAIFVQNPDTASAWTVAEAEAAEVGVRSIA